MLPVFASLFKIASGLIGVAFVIAAFICFAPSFDDGQTSNGMGVFMLCLSGLCFYAMSRFAKAQREVEVGMGSGCLTFALRAVAVLAAFLFLSVALKNLIGTETVERDLGVAALAAFVGILILFFAFKRRKSRKITQAHMDTIFDMSGVSSLMNPPQKKGEADGFYLDENPHRSRRKNADTGEIAPKVALALLSGNPRGKVFSIMYEDADGKISRKQIKVKRIFQTDQGNYLAVSICFEKRAERHFRLDRILSIERAE